MFETMNILPWRHKNHSNTHASNTTFQTKITYLWASWQQLLLISNIKSQYIWQWTFYLFYPDTTWHPSLQWLHMKCNILSINILSLKHIITWNLTFWLCIFHLGHTWQMLLHKSAYIWDLKNIFLKTIDKHYYKHSTSEWHFWPCKFYIRKKNKHCYIC